MWCDHTFSQSNKATKRVQGKGVEPPPPFLAKRQEDLSMIFSQNLNFQEKLLTLKILNDLENCKNGTKKGKKLLGMKNNNYIICHTPYLRNNLAYDHDFWRTCVKS